MHTATPGTTGHGGTRRDSSDGAIPQILGGSPAGPAFHQFNRYSRIGNSEVHSPLQFSPIQRQQNSPYFARMVPDWDTRRIIPHPTATFIQRLKKIQRLEDRQPNMKPVYTMTKYFKNTFNGSKFQDWANHIDLLESTVFQAHDFIPKQCYFAIKATLTSTAQQCLQNLELGLERPDWRQCIPPWYEPTREDLAALVHRHGFSNFSYPFKCALVIVYFHQKFQRGTVKIAWKRFEDAAQLPKESIERWALRLEKLEIDLRRYGTEIPFSDLLEKWATGTSPGFFLSELRKAKNQVHPDKPPLIHDRQSFELWKNAMISNARQTRIEAERHQELIARRERQQPKSRYVKQPYTPAKSDTKPGERQQTAKRNPHSNLLRKRSETNTTPGRKRDMSKIKCYNCNQMGHFASKCPLPKRPRQQRLQAHVATTMPEYQPDEMGTPEAIRDSLQISMQTFLANVMTVIEPIITTPPDSDLTAHEAEAHATQNDEHMPDDSEQQEDLHTPMRDSESDHQHSPLTNESGERDHPDDASEYTYAANDLNAVRAGLTLDSHKASIASATAEAPTEEAIENSDSSSEDELPAPSMLKFIHCVDQPLNSWSEDTDEAVSLLTDLLYPRLKQLMTKKGTLNPPFTLDEISQITWWCCMCVVTSQGEIAEIMVGVFSSCLKAWKAQRSALRRAQRKCIQLSESLGEKPVGATEIDMAIRNCAQMTSEHALVDTIMQAMGLRSVSKATPTNVTGLRYEVRAKMDESGEATHVAILLSTNQIPVTVTEKGYALVHKAPSAPEAWQFINAWLTTDRKPSVLVVDPLNLLASDTFWQLHGLKVVRNLPPPPDPDPEVNKPTPQVTQEENLTTSSTKDPDESRDDQQQLLNTHAVPMRIRFVRNQKSKQRNSAANKIISELIDRVKKMESYVLACNNPDSPQETLTSWLFDTGTEVSQISMKASNRLWTALSPVDIIRVECRTAHSTQRMDVQLCSLHNFQLWDPFEGCKQKTIDTLVIINPKLKVHDCVLGKNTMRDLRIMANMRSDTIHTYTGKRIRMLSTQAEKDWSEYSDDVYEEGEVPPWQKPGKPQWMKRMHSRATENPAASKGGTTPKSNVTKYHRVRKPSKSTSTQRSHKIPGSSSSPSITKSWNTERVKAKREVAQRWGSTIHKYTQDDEQQLRMAQRRMAMDEQEDEALRARIAQVSLHAHRSKAPDSPMLYQPYKRLIRVADLVDESTDESACSVLGANANDSTFTGTPPSRSSRYDDSPPWAAAYPLPMQYTKDGTPISVEMSAVTPIQTSRHPEYWTPTGTTSQMPSGVPPATLHATSAVNDSKDVTLGSTELFIRTQQHFSSPVPMREPKRSASKVQSKLSFKPTKSSSAPVNARAEEFPLDEDFVAQVEASMDEHTRSKFDPTTMEDPVQMPFIFDPTIHQFPIPPSQLKNSLAASSPEGASSNPADIDATPSVDILQASLNVDFPPMAQHVNKPLPPGHTAVSPKDSLQHTLQQAASFGAYMPILVNGIATVWHVDSGATLTQISPDMMKQFQGTLIKLDEGNINFNSAVGSTTTKVTLYRANKVALMHLEAKVTTEAASTQIVCNPQLAPGTMLFGLGSLKDLGVRDDFVNDTLIDSSGRPFRKIPRARLKTLKQKTCAWNRRQTSLPVKQVPRPDLRKPSTSEQPLINNRKSTPPPRTNPESERKVSNVEMPSGQAAHAPTFSYQGFHANKFDKAESTNDAKYFRKCVIAAPHQTYLWTKASGKHYPNFDEFIDSLHVVEPQLYHEYVQMQTGPKLPRKRHSQRRRRNHALKTANPRPSKPPDPQAHMHSAKAKLQSPPPPPQPPYLPEAPGPPIVPPQADTFTRWSHDPTPPHLVRKLQIPKQHLPDKALEIHPDLFWSLSKKANEKWGRTFDVMGAAGCFRLRSNTGNHDIWVNNKIIPKLKHRAMLIIPSAKSVQATLRRVMKATQRSQETAALLLVPQALLDIPEVSTFLHAYAERGETYNQGPRFREVGKTDWLQINQAVHEFWINPAGKRYPQITRSQQKLLDRLLFNYSQQLGDANTSAAQRQTNATKQVPYVRLPVKQGAQPASEPPFKKNPTVRQLTIDFVRDLEARGLVSRCTAEEAVFVCNSLMLPKPNNKYRFVCTFQHLNSNMLKDPYGMRTLDAVMTALEGKSWFSVLDVVDGFFNLPLYPADRGYTAFHTPIGVYKWNVLPQGTAASPQIFQRTMDKWFASFLWKSVIIWMDDLLVHSTTFKEHLVHLQQVLEVAKKYGLVFNKSKLNLCQRSVRYIGYIFGVDGIHADPDKVADVHKLPAPATPKQVRQFLGFAGFYRRFMPPSYATLIAPLTELTRKSVPFVWTNTCQRAFDRIKTLLTTTPVLSHPDFCLPFHIHCDASGKGIGAVLSQYVDGSYRPIAFCSKRLLPHQTHWAPAQLEAYAVFYAVCVKWRYYLALNKTIVHTDHRNLSWLFTQSHKGMIGRWHAQLCAYDLDITYVQGKTQVVADPLSRLLTPPKPAPKWVHPLHSQANLQALTATLHNHTPAPMLFGINACPAGLTSNVKHTPLFNSSSDAPARDFKFLNMFMASNDTACRLPKATWAQEQRQDQRLGPIVRYLTRTTTQTYQPVQDWVKVAAQSYRMHHGILQYRAPRRVGQHECNTGWVLAVPNKLTTKVIRECHSSGILGHNGIVKTVLAIRQRYHFLGLRKAVTRFIANCNACIRSKSFQLPNIVPLSPMFAPAPFNAIAIDLFKPGITLPSGYRYVLTIVDMCTRWVQFIPLRSKYASEVMLNLCKYWFALHGVPEFILSDRGKEFMGVVTTICTACDIKQIRTTPGHPQANGLCEGQHRTLTRELKIRSRRQNRPSWDDLLPEIQFALNVSPDLAPPGISPFQMVFGRRPRLAGQDITFPSKVVPSPTLSADAEAYVQQLCKRLENFNLAALDKQLHRKEMLRLRHDNERSASNIHTYSRGDLVHRFHRTSHPKLQYQWSNPVWLVVKVQANTCKLKSLISAHGRQGKHVPATVTNVKHMRPAPPRPTDFWVGARVRRQFHRNWFLGTVVGITTDEGETLYQVEYDDCDQEQLDAGQLWDAVVYHPRMDDITEPATLFPEIGHFILFALDQLPRIGRVTAVDMDALKPVTIHLWKPNKRRPSLEQAHFKPSNTESGPDLMAIHGSQIKITGLELNDSGHLTGPSKRKVRKLLKPVKSASPVSPKSKPVRRSRKMKKTTARSTRNNSKYKSTRITPPAESNSQPRNARKSSRYNLRSRR